MLYQDQLAVIGELSGPGSLRAFSFQESLLAANLTVGFPTRKTLKLEKELRTSPSLLSLLSGGCQRQERWSRLTPNLGMI